MKMKREKELRQLRQNSIRLARAKILVQRAIESNATNTVGVWDLMLSSVVDKLDAAVIEYDRKSQAVSKPNWKPG